MHVQNSAVHYQVFQKFGVVWVLDADRAEQVNKNVVLLHTMEFQSVLCSE